MLYWNRLCNSKKNQESPVLPGQRWHSNRRNSNNMKNSSSKVDVAEEKETNNLSKEFTISKVIQVRGTGSGAYETVLVHSWSMSSHFILSHTFPPLQPHLYPFSLLHKIFRHPYLKYSSLFCSWQYNSDSKIQFKIFFLLWQTCRQNLLRSLQGSHMHYTTCNNHWVVCWFICICFYL